MALIVIMAAEDRAFKKYDVVEILPDGFSAGKEVYYPTFLIFRIPGNKSELDYLLDPLTVPDSTRPGARREVSPRLYRFNFDSKVSAETLQAIRDSEEFLFVDIDINDIEENY